MLKKYAKLIVSKGVNVQKDQDVIIRGSVEEYEFIRLLVEESYLVGARKVWIDYADDKITRLAFAHQSLETLEEIPDWIIEKTKYGVNHSACMISITSSSPDALKGLDQEKIRANQMVSMKKMKFFHEAMMANHAQWNVVAVPSKEWASKVFPTLSNEEAVEALWKAILTCSRVDETSDSVENWNVHNKNLQNKAEYLNKINCEYLHFYSSNGTDFKIGLVKNHIWCGGKDISQSGIEFNPNIPTEEIFTMPDCNVCDGKVVSTYPLNYMGQLIEDFWLVFKNGKVIDYGAKVNEKILKMMLESDEGAKRLGEVALVPYNSPISNSKILFFNTLFDENASCHLALGASYPTNLLDYKNYTSQQLQELGSNESLIHVDFMIGSKDLSIDGYTKEGKKIQIFKNGNWA